MYSESTGIIEGIIMYYLHYVLITNAKFGLLFCVIRHYRVVCDFVAENCVALSQEANT
jgi:hypothetical protein